MMKHNEQELIDSAILARFPEENPNPVLLACQEGRIHYANAPAKALLYQHGLCDQDCGKLTKEALSRLIPSIKKSQVIGLQLKDRHYQVFSSQIDEPAASFLFFQEITPQKQYESLLYLTESVIENTIEGIFVTDSEGIIERVNPAFTRITGYSPMEAIGKTPRIFKSNRQDDDFYRHMWAEIREKGYWQGELWNRKRDGHAIPVWQSITAIRNSALHIEKYVAVFHDMSEIKSSQEKLQHQAYHDFLTLLPNRQLFIDRLQQAIASSKRNGSKVAVLLMDLDNFKKINDSLGHHLGDKFLQIIAERLKASCREEDTISRLGGDEFAMINLYINSQNDVIDILERVEEAISQPILLEGHEMIPEASIGVTFFPDDGDNPHSLLQNADLAMYKAKRSERDKYALFNPSLQESAYLRVRLESEMRRALQTDQFKMYYQPQVDAKTDRVIGVEALVRWQQGEEVISPADFIPVAEETGLIFPLGRQIIEMSCREIAEFHQRGYPELSVAVNISGKQFQDATLPGQILEISQSSNLSRGKFHIEITENVAVSDVNSALHMMNELSKQGIGVAIDDFGTGYSSLSYIKRFQAEILKIDKSFIDDLPADKATGAIVQAIISMSHAVGMRVVAEGVETKDQVEYLRNVGCDYIQGFYYSKPLLLHELISRLDKDYILHS